MSGGSLPSARTNDHRDLERGRIPADHSVSSQRLVPWSPVIPVKLVPIEPGGDTGGSAEARPTRPPSSPRADKSRRSARMTCLYGQHASLASEAGARLDAAR